MTDQNMKMPDLSKTIYQLKEEVKRADYIDTDYLHCVDVNVLKDAFALLKAQEPRVITFDEIDNYEVLWLEVLDVNTEDGLAPWVKTKSGHWFSPLLCGDARPEMTLCTSDEYMRICRCWTSRPTAEQMEATPWN